MEPIVRQSKTSSYFSIGYVIAGSWTPNKAQHVEFQKALLDNGLDFSQTMTRSNGFQLRREPPNPLQITLESPAPQVHSMQIVSNNPGTDLEFFCKDVQATAAAYQQTWPAEHFQVLTTNAKIHHLYSTSGHAFQYLWETRLGQSPQDFKALGSRPVGGGGLRFLFPPHAVNGSELVSIELRIESFLREPGKMLIETVFSWPRPRTFQKDEYFNPAHFLQMVENFAANEVWEFITAGPSENS